MQVQTLVSGLHHSGPCYGHDLSIVSDVLAETKMSWIGKNAWIIHFASLL